jgi:hypothetical protein
MITRTIHQTLAVGAWVLLAGCSRDATPQPVPEAPAPVLTPAARPHRSAPDRPRCLERFALFDRDGDRRVSREEFEVHAHALANPAVVFQFRDSNGDGFLSELEFCSGQASAPGKKQGGPGGALFEG